MAIDSIIAEIRKTRDALSDRFNGDLHAIVEDARKRQLAGGRQVVSFAPRTVQKGVVTSPAESLSGADLPS